MPWDSRRVDVRAACVVSCLLMLALCGCARSPEPTDEVGFPHACMAILIPFCITENLSAYSISIERNVEAPHYSLYFIKANARDTGELVLLATIEPMTDDAANDVADDVGRGCTLLETSIADCEHWSRVLVYEYTPPGWRGAPMHWGIRQRVVARKGVFGGEPNIALPCQLLETGALRCAANLPRCEIDKGEAGCKIG